MTGRVCQFFSLRLSLCYQRNHKGIKLAGHDFVHSFSSQYHIERMKYSSTLHIAQAAVNLVQGRS
ncbi:hypothetical protein CY34DRAFT_448064 [Suillus luteus UH-Slu-Lm8-n1]|uniref:Unplaced genomic scaffold CY34scaffold_31, whole genome shotgun sequence n=1 Tax=Suillus luteus UH-Slu-Lm8-n1 TaxID=930992 RepID=A0A0D0B8M2_9AGAM|nr:hypothetical protein CY34DRAFT_448064 [Suillus luteus UH-Slu-Lm8-n1]